MNVNSKEELEIYKCLSYSGKVIIVIRGGAWLSIIYQIYPMFRYPCIPNLYNVDMGFRCIRKVKK